MHARFRVKGTIARSGDDLIIYGDILEGSIRAGMFINISLPDLQTVTERIRSIEFVDDIDGGATTYVGLGVRSADDNPADWTDLALDGEILEVAG
jgi:hypothetical protein